MNKFLLMLAVATSTSTAIFSENNIVKSFCAKNYSATDYDHCKVKFQNITFNADIPQNAHLKALGLGGRESIPETYGMLWKYDHLAKPNFWMKGMIIPIDIIWIAKNKIVDISENLQPPTSDTKLIVYQPKEAVDSVLEIAAGGAKKYNLTIGSSVNFE